jgi:hypothetical protein
MVLNDDAWAQETDHRPVVADFRVPGFFRPHRSRWKRRRRQTVARCRFSNEESPDAGGRSLPLTNFPLNSCMNVSIKFIRTHSRWPPVSVLIPAE